MPGAILRAGDRGHLRGKTEPEHGLIELCRWWHAVGKVKTTSRPLAVKSPAPVRISLQRAG